MAQLIDLPTFHDQRGALSVIERCLPFDIKRIYYLYHCDGKVRGEHRHIKTDQALVCLHGQCDVYVNDGHCKQTFTMSQPDQCLLLMATDWHRLENISGDAVILLLASHYYDVQDYIDEEYA